MQSNRHSKAISPNAEFALEAHHYDGGLRVESLNPISRPSWVPSTDYVGFRNEIEAGESDSVIEFARFAIDDTRVSWIGVSRSSIDQTFGDRKNSDAVGIWLLNSNATNPAPLLDGLDQLAAEVARGNVNQIAGDARQFGDEFLPKFIAAQGGLPSALGGWPYSQTALPETAFFLAESESKEERWKLAAEHLLRMQFLPPGKTSHSRALILVRGGGARRSQTGLTLLKSGFGETLVRYLPDALSQTNEANQELIEEAKRLSLKLEDANGALDALRTESNALREQLGSLEHENRELLLKSEEYEKQLQENDLLRRLSSIDSLLRALDDRMRGLEGSNRDLRSQLSSTLASASRGRPSTSEIGSHSRREPITFTDGGTAGYQFNWPLLGWLLLAVALFALLIWLVLRFLL